jgi:acyl-CoA thioester hydrolase
MPLSHTYRFRVRYADIDAMGTYYNSRALDWFEVGRTELCRTLGKPYRQWEREGVAVPLVTAHVEYRGRAEYDDELIMTTTVSMAGKARLRFEVEVEHSATGQPVCRGHTIHAITDLSGRPIRPPQWLLEMVASPPELLAPIDRASHGPVSRHSDAPVAAVQDVGPVAGRIHPGT